MNPFVAQILGSLFRAALQWAAAYLVARGIWTPEDASTYVAGAVVALVALTWSLYQKYGQTRFALTALTMPVGSTAADVHEQIAVSGAPSVLTKKTDVPVPQP